MKIQLWLQLAETIRQLRETKPEFASASAIRGADLAPHGARMARTERHRGGRAEASPVGERGLSAPALPADRSPPGRTALPRERAEKPEVSCRTRATLQRGERQRTAQPGGVTVAGGISHDTVRERHAGKAARCPANVTRRKARA